MWTYALYNTLQIKHTCLEQTDITLLNRTSEYTARISKENPATSTNITLGTVDLPEKLLMYQLLEYLAVNTVLFILLLAILCKYILSFLNFSITAHIKIACGMSQLYCS